MNTLTEVGAYGWEHGGWENKFYPDELPEDWHFSYYSQQFHTAILPHAMLCSCLHKMTAGQPIEWLDDLYPEFALFIELDPVSLADKAMIDNLAGLLDKLADSFAGFVLAAAGCYPLKQTQEKHIAQQLASWFSVYDQSMHLLVQPAELDSWKPIVRSYDQLTFCWQPETAWPHECQLTVIDAGASPMDLRQLGQWISQFKQQEAGSAASYLFINGQPPSQGLLNDAQTLLTLF